MRLHSMEAWTIQHMGKDSGGELEEEDAKRDEWWWMRSRVSRRERDECIMEVKRMQEKTTLETARQCPGCRRLSATKTKDQDKRRADEPFQPANGQKHLLCTKKPSNR